MIDTLTLTQRRLRDVLTAIAEAGQACPTNDGLADRLACDPRDVARAMGALRDLGLIEIRSDRKRREITIVATGRATAPNLPAQRSNYGQGRCP